MKTRVSNDEWIEICKTWISVCGQKLPSRDDTIIINDRIYNIGTFILGVKQGAHQSIHKKLEELFNCKIEYSKRLSPDEWVDVCKLWVDTYGHTIPRATDVIVYDDRIVNIGNFIQNLKAGSHTNIKDDVERIFNIQIVHNRIKRASTISDDEWIEICEAWIETNGKIFPKLSDKFMYAGNVISIGYLMGMLKTGRKESIRSKIEKLFDMPIISAFCT